MSDNSQMRDYCRDLLELSEQYGQTDIKDPAIPLLKLIAKKAGRLERFARELIKEGEQK